MLPDAPADLPSADACEPVPLDQRRIRLITELSAQLLDLDAAALDVAATARRGAAEGDLALAIILRAGRPIPPGLSAARRAQRATRSDEAVAWLERELETKSGRQLVESSLELALAGRDRGMPSIPELEVAASFVVAELELVELAPNVARLLGEDSPPEVRGGARAALFQLYARWFDTPADFTARWDDLRGRSPAGTGRDELRTAIELANERAIALLELAPARFGDAPLEWPGPAMAARAARSLGRAVASGGLEPASARAFLVEGIDEVQDPTELHARLGVLIDLVQGAEPTSDAAVQSRAVVVDVTRNSIDAGPDAVWVAVGALPRLQYADGPAGEAERVETLRVGVDAYRIALRSRRVRPLDPDALQAATVALRDVARSVADHKVREDTVRLLVRDLRSLVGDPAMPLGVRRAAANSLTISSTAADALGLAELVQSKDTPEELVYELLGALKVVVKEVDPTSDDARTIVDRLFEIVAEPNFDRRARALDLLLSAELAPALDQALDPAQRRTKARWVVIRLGAEGSPELQEQLLRLVSRIGEAESLALLLEKPGAVEDLAKAGAGVARAAAEATGQLAEEGDIETLALVAQRIAGPLGVDDAFDPDRVERLRVALDMVLGVDVASASTYSPATHRWVLAAVADLRRAYPVLAPAQLDAPSRRRILDVHAAALATPSDGEDDMALAALVRGLVGADVIIIELEAHDPSVALTDEQLGARRRAVEVAVAGFDAAMAEPEAIARFGWSALQLRLECVELLRHVGLETAALGRLDVLFEGGTSATNAPPRAVRLFAELVHTTVDGTAVGVDRQRVLRASDALLAIATSEGWGNEDDMTRLGDLISLAELAQRADDPVRCAPTIAFLEGQLVGDDKATIARRLALGAVDELGFATLTTTMSAIATPIEGADAPVEGDGGDGSSARNP